MTEAILRRVASIRVSTLQFGESERFNGTQKCHASCCLREKFSWQTPETLTLRQFADSAPVHDKLLLHRFSPVSSTTKISGMEARIYVYVEFINHAYYLNRITRNFLLPRDDIAF